MWSGYLAYRVGYLWVQMVWELTKSKKSWKGLYVGTYHIIGKTQSCQQRWIYHLRRTQFPISTNAHPVLYPPNRGNKHHFHPWYLPSIPILTDFDPVSCSPSGQGAEWIGIESDRFTLCIWRTRNQTVRIDYSLKLPFKFTVGQSS